MSDINETRAQFLDTDKDESKLSEKASHTLRSALKKQEKQKLGGRETNFENSNGVESSPLLNSTPPTVSKALVKLALSLLGCLQ